MGMMAWRSTAGAGVLAIAAVSAAAAAPRLVQHQIVVQGNQNFNVTGINDNGVMVGSLFTAITGAENGVIVKGSTVTTIAPPYTGSGPARPTSIYDDGTIIGNTELPGQFGPGSTGFAEIFVLRQGVIDPDYQIVLDYGTASGPPLGINTLGLVGGEVFFTRVISRTLPNAGLYGTPPHFRQVPQIGLFNTIKGLSAAGVVSGTSFQLRGAQSVFVGSGKNFITIAPPGAISTSGGYANKAGDIAGSYVDAANVPHGFVYSGGAFRTFDMPDAAAGVVVNAINDKGWVVGSYTGANYRKQHAFLYDGTSVTRIGTYSRDANLSAALNNVGQTVVSEQLLHFGVPIYLSFMATCVGGSC